MGWDLEECVEDAIVAYLRQASAELRLYAAMEVTSSATPQMPCVIVGVESARNPDDDGQFSGRRQMDVAINILQDIAPDVDAQGVEVTPFRQRSRAVRSAVIEYLARPSLHTHLNDLQPRGVAFSIAHMTDSAQTVDGRVAITAITLDVIAQPTDER